MTVDIKHVRELLAKATPGPWEVHPHSPTDICLRPHPSLDSDCINCHTRENAQLIAALRNNAEELIVAYENLQDTVGEGGVLDATLDELATAATARANILAGGDE